MIKQIVFFGSVIPASTVNETEIMLISRLTEQAKYGLVSAIFSLELLLFALHYTGFIRLPALYKV